MAFLILMPQPSKPLLVKAVTFFLPMLESYVIRVFKQKKKTKNVKGLRLINPSLPATLG